MPNGGIPKAARDALTRLIDQAAIELDCSPNKGRGFLLKWAPSNIALLGRLQDNNMSIQAGQVVVKFIADTSGYTSGVSQAANQTLDFSNQTKSSMRLAGQAIKAFATGYAVKKIVDFGKQSVILAGEISQLEVVNRRLAKNAGIAQSVIKEQTQAVKSMGIESKSANQSIAKFMQAELDITKASKLARVAQDAAVVGLTNSSDAFDRLVHGVATLNPLMLRQLGIYVTADEAYNKFANSVGKSASELSSAEKQAAFLNETLVKSVNIAGLYEEAMKEPVKQMGSWVRHFENIKESFGAPFQDLFRDVVFDISASLKNGDELAGQIAHTIVNGINAGLGRNVSAGHGYVAGSDGVPRMVGLSKPAAAGTPTEEFISEVVRTGAGIAGTTKDVGGDVLAGKGGWNKLHQFGSAASAAATFAGSGLSMIAKYIAGDKEGALGYARRGVDAMELMGARTNALLGKSNDGWLSYMGDFRSRNNLPMSDAYIGMRTASILEQPTLPGFSMQPSSLGVMRDQADMQSSGTPFSSTYTDYFLQKFTESLPNAATGISSQVQSIMDQAMSAGEMQESSLLASSVVEQFQAAIGESNMPAFMSKQLSEWIKPIIEADDELKTTGKSIPEGLAAGVQSGNGLLSSAVRSIVENAIQAAKNAAAISSPSKVFMDIGANVVEGFAIGIDNHRDDGTASIQKMINSFSEPNASSLRGGQEINFYFKDTTLNREELERAMVEIERSVKYAR